MNDRPDYSAYTVPQLFEVQQTIDSNEAPDNYNRLLAELERRKEEVAACLAQQRLVIRNKATKHVNFYGWLWHTSRTLHVKADDPRAFQKAFLSKLLLALQEELLDVKRSAASLVFRGSIFMLYLRRYLHCIDHGAVEVNGDKGTVRYSIRTKHLFLYLSAILGSIWIATGLAVLFGQAPGAIKVLWLPPFLFVAFFGWLSGYGRLRFRALVQKMVEEAGGSLRKCLSGKPEPPTVRHDE